MKTIKIGSRDSRLAIVQSETVIAAIRAYDPTISVELVTMKTTGDKILDRTLDQVGGKGLFVKELDRALQEGAVDLTVHSLKDMPLELTPGLPIVAVSKRADPRDALVLPEGSMGFDPQKPIGCASARRRVQMQRLFPSTEVRPVRGNLQTRLRKLEEEGFGALVLAAAGLERLGLSHRIYRFFEPEECLPSAGQGILAVQAREGEDVSFLSQWHCQESWTCAEAERAFIRRLDGGCSAPVAAYATQRNHTLQLRGMYVSADEKTVRFGTLESPTSSAEHAGTELAALLQCGGSAL